MSDFLSSITGKAQNALKSAGFNAGHSNDPASEGGQSGLLKSHAIESIHHQLRTFQQQYSSSVPPFQKVITAQKGVALDIDSLARDSHAHSKELYTWGQQEDPDVKDVTDRLAWIVYIEGSLAHTLATRIDGSRAPLKALRDSENTLNGRRNIRVALYNQIAHIEADQQRGSAQKLAELRQQLQQAESNDEPLEKEVQLLKRKAVRDSEQMKWQAIREYAEKLILLSQGANAVLTALPTVPPADHQYHGAETTASVRAALQQALDNYKPGDITLPLGTSSSRDLSRSDTRSFGETHASELSRISSVTSSVQPSIPMTPPPTTGNVPPPAPSAAYNSPVSYTTYTGSRPPVPARGSPIVAASVPPAGVHSPPLNPAVLNQAPAPIPIPSTSPTSVVAPNPTDPSVQIPSAMPTIAETGVPQSAGSDGPGPASGSLLDLKSPSPDTARNANAGQNARGLSKADGLPNYGDLSGASLNAAPASEKQYETAEEEKKRLAREERERVLAAEGSSASGEGEPPRDEQEQDGDPELPPYQEF